MSSSRLLVLISAIGAALVALQWKYNQGYQLLEETNSSNRNHTGDLEYECSEKPHHSSWGTWLHPQRLWSRPNGQGAGTTTKDWNILYHLGGNGPWVEKVADVVEGGVAVPDGCIVEQVHMMSRHAERYPTKKAGTRMRNLLERMKKSRIEFTGDLAFVNDWDLFWSDDTRLAQLTSTGPFSGTLGSFTTGVRFRTRYEHLVARALSRPNPTTLWASDSHRVIDTARYFASGLFGIDWKDVASLDVIPETAEMGGDSLTPGDTCPAYIEDETEGWAKGWKTMHAYRATYLPIARTRLLAQNPGIEFTDDELYAMQEMCGFETTVRGSSRWCDVFTQQEFLHFEYARDLHHYYRAGPGTKYGAGLGFLWLNATVNLMLEGPEAGPMFFSFVHDDDMAPMLAALDIIDDIHPLPLDHIPEDRLWRKSQISPMGGRITLEVMSCAVETQGHVGKDNFVRININDGVTAIPGCDKGPGRSCRLSGFAAKVRRKGVEVGDFREMCGLPEDAAGRITFLHQ
ncbi:phosphoglycerate mutase-like protein [Aaosphaeria arxii CBS 175.79]|uniref:Phosphoglycerate mutase-like protein n=1 Tax=Aaosphaeria arxii CBS 175.79 TaxID=1450172 RepID=A0A6A5XVW3_9PLEO|nr:phosphoglycerate mutase-like protein [Aaosphaeria arxii CBS 175.79]KAF2017465.1 phosphoglycerate mutase-like protein [Aaosphaeria arxii CBS 175.79]